jgi:hypothetical protein
MRRSSKLERLNLSKETYKNLVIKSILEPKELQAVAGGDDAESRGCTNSETTY